MLPKLIGVLILTTLFYNVQAQQKGYYRMPALYKNTVVFSAEGDLWKYDINKGGTASRLTSHPGQETNPIISIDGKQIAFLGEYEGGTDIYVIDINGGLPKRVSYDFDGFHVELQGWLKDGRILYRTEKFSKLPDAQLAILDPATMQSELIPLSQASQGSYDESGDLYFTRFPNQGSKTKRYKGGLIEQVWKFDGKKEAINLTGDFEGTSARPMYYNNKVYFISDRDGTMNLWSTDKNGGAIKQITFSKGWDLQSPNLQDGKIVYQKGADLWIYDIASASERELDITLLSDFDQRKTKWIKSPVNSISYSSISPNGNYAAIISRGRVFVSPSKSDRWMEVFHKSGVRNKAVEFVNNKTIAVISDESGEYEVWTINADGSGDAKQITKNSKTIISSITVSPNGKWLAYNDKNEVLRVADMKSGEVKFTYDSTFGGTNGMSWSPDSRYLSFTATIENLNRQINVLDLNTMRRRIVTTPRLDSYNSSWSTDSSWFYFVSDRELHTRVNSPWGARQPEPYYNEISNIYAMPLDTAAKFPFLLTDSWLADSAFAIAEKASAKKTSGGKVYDWDHALQSLYEVPIKSTNIGDFEVANGFMYWIDRGADGGSGKLLALRIGESRKYEPTEVASGISSFVLSANKKKILIQFANKTFAISEANGAKLNMDEAKLVLNNWSFSINPQEEWNEMFQDAWRMMRDYFYDKNLHGVKWEEVRKQYEPLMARVTDRYELDDVLSQMVGELSALHTFVYGGDKRKSPDVVPLGFLGAELEHTTKGARIKHIYRSDPDYPDFTSPLNRPELKIREGDIITAINNIPLTGNTSVSYLLSDKVNSPVKLTLLNRNLVTYEEVVKPYSATQDFLMRYGEWEISKREEVDNLSNNEIGYVHLKAMGAGDMDDFVKQFYPIFNRKGLIIDVRHNNGGNIDSWVLEKLLRKTWMYWQARTGGAFWNMPYAFRGPMVILCDQSTASDGEAITEGFRRLGLGKVIGMRTWGGEIWLSQDNRMVDNGIASAAELGVFGPEGKWLIEGRGVEPDMVVDNLPFETFKGKDAQLNMAIDYLKKQIKAAGSMEIKVPAYPDKSFKYKK